jgi:hypothetical protein
MISSVPKEPHPHPLLLLTLLIEVWGYFYYPLQRLTKLTPKPVKAP